MGCYLAADDGHIAGSLCATHLVSVMLLRCEGDEEESTRRSDTTLSLNCSLAGRTSSATGRSSTGAFAAESGLMPGP